MKIKIKSNRKAIKLIAIVSAFAILLGIALPYTANLIDKENASIEMTNALERSTRASTSVSYRITMSTMGNSVSEDISGLAFGFKVRANGLKVKNGNEVVYDDAKATVEGTTYKLLGMGAIVHNKESGKKYTLEDCNKSTILDVPVVYLMSLKKDTGEATFAIRITDIPDKAKDTHITAVPYILIDKKGTKTPIYFYDCLRTRTFNEAMNGTDQVCDCYHWSIEDDYLFLGRKLIPEDEFSPSGESLSGIKIPSKPTSIKTLIKLDWCEATIRSSEVITINFKCTYGGTGHTVIIPKECRYDHH